MAKNQIHTTETFSPQGTTRPEDWSLGLENTFEQSDGPYEYVQIWQRFSRMGWVEQYGNQCLLMSQLLRRIMRLHGFPATVKQVWMQYEKSDRGWHMAVGKPGDHVPGNSLSVDTHSVVVSQGWILDFSLVGLNNRFGALAPKALITKDSYNTWQKLVFFGRVRYFQRPEHFETLNERVLNRPKILELTQEYFRHFRVREN